MSELPVRHEPAARRFVVGAGDTEAVLEYEESGETMIFTHTFVPPTLRGGGIAGRLVAAGVEFADAHGKTIVPACSYVAAWLTRNPR